MKTRIVKTKFWTDSVVSELSQEAKMLFIYFITSPFIGLNGVFECTDKQIQFQTSLSNKELIQAKKELQEKKRVFSYEGWVWVVNAERHTDYRKSLVNEKAYQKELSLIPEAVKEFFGSQGYSTPPSTHKSETRSNNPEIGNNNQESRKEVEFK